jgi:RimJ/RimL family protein N-acetyltransferase
MNVTLRPWTLKDVDFSLKVRNHPDCMKWFRQNEAITRTSQELFIELDMKYYHYNGNVILVDGVAAGLCGVKETREFTIAILPEWQGKNVATQVMQQTYFKE